MKWGSFLSYLAFLSHILTPIEFYTWLLIKLCCIPFKATIRQGCNLIETNSPHFLRIKEIVLLLERYNKKDKELVRLASNPRSKDWYNTVVSVYIITLHHRERVWDIPSQQFDMLSSASSIWEVAKLLLSSFGSSLSDISWSISMLILYIYIYIYIRSLQCG